MPRRSTSETAEFDATLATYTISAVPDPVAVLREMRRVTKPGGTLVILNHFRSRNPGDASDRGRDGAGLRATSAGRPTSFWIRCLKTVGLTPEVVRRVNLLRGWCLVKVHQPGTVTAPGADLSRPGRSRWPRPRVASPCRSCR